MIQKHYDGAFFQCEKELEFWDNSLLREMKG